MLIIIKKAKRERWDMQRVAGEVGIFKKDMMTMEDLSAKTQ